MESVTILIGNSDDRLTQEEWSQYIQKIKEVLSYWCTEIHFIGGTSFESQWQTACFVGTVSENNKNKLVLAVSSIRKDFKQNSSAVIFGQVMMV